MISKDAFRKTIRDYYEESRREFPWRETTDPYKIWISEVMLQQTQTSRVLPKYLSFIKKFPDFKSLTEASLPDLLQQWSGLGYNRRALYLQQSAQKLIKEFQGILPTDPKELETFPGIGKATARSILVFSKNIPLVFIETNIRRVYIHLFFTNQENVSDAEIEKVLEQTLDKQNPREFYYALMDYGAMLAKIEQINPNRKSKHYSKQSNFETSVRKIRGEILRQLLAKKSLSKKALENILNNDSRFEAALLGLQKDNLITLTKTIIQIKK